MPPCGGQRICVWEVCGASYLYSIQRSDTWIRRWGGGGAGSVGYSNQADTSAQKTFQKTGEERGGSGGGCEKSTKKSNNDGCDGGACDLCLGNRRAASLDVDVSSGAARQGSPELLRTDKDALSPSLSAPSLSLPYAAAAAVAAAAPPHPAPNSLVRALYGLRARSDPAPSIRTARRCQRTSALEPRHNNNNKCLKIRINPTYFRHMASAHTVLCRKARLDHRSLSLLPKCPSANRLIKSGYVDVAK